MNNIVKCLSKIIKYKYRKLLLNDNYYTHKKHQTTKVESTNRRCNVDQSLRDDDGEYRMRP